MSGRDHEPLSAFFPAIDRNLIRDLDRHLRGAQAVHAQATHAQADHAQADHAAIARGEVPNPAKTLVAPEMVPAPTPARTGLRPDIAHVVEAVEHAGQSMADMQGRIEELESHIGQLEGVNATLAEKLAVFQQQIADLDAKLKAETDRTARIEAVAAQQAARAAALDRELNAAHGDLARITDTIAATLGFPHRA